MKKTALFLTILLIITIYISVIIPSIFQPPFLSPSPSAQTAEHFVSVDDHRMVEEGDDDINLIVSRYKEDISWTDDPPFNKYKVVCYNKGDDLPKCKAPKCKVISLPNIGRCDHTVLHHIITNYDNLAKISVFLPASCLDKHKIKTTFKLMYLVEKTQTTVLLGKLYDSVSAELGRLFINKHVATNEVNQKANPETILLPCPIRPFGRWYEAMFGQLVSKVVCYFGVFAVAREHIIQHPKEHYEKLIKFVDNHSNPEAGHYMERSWGAIFAPYPESCLHDAMDVYPEYFRIPGFEYSVK